MRWLLVAAFLFLTGCEKGCLSTWLRDRGVGGSSHGTFALEGTDCSDGLARCVAGRVEVSRAAHLSTQCTGSEGRACTCPWDVAARCTSGCVEEGREVIAPPEVARTQLCRPLAPVVRPFVASDAAPLGVCSAAGLTCFDGVLRSCDRPGTPVRALGVCLHGCEPRVGLSSDHGEAPTIDGAAAILCAHPLRERR